MSNLQDKKKSTHGGKRVKGQFDESKYFGMYNVLDIKRMMDVKDARARRRVSVSQRDKAVILVDKKTKITDIDFDCTICIRKGCWEILIHEQDLASQVKELASQLDAIAYI